MSTVAERVAAGATVLDEHAPDWVDRISLADLNIGSCRRCVLGQVFGHYFTGLDKLGLRGVALAVEHGFSTPRRQAGELTAEWYRLVEARRAQARAEVVS